jgi:methyl-accepting chemotaxis protein
MKNLSLKTKLISFTISIILTLSLSLATAVFIDLRAIERIQSARFSEYSSSLSNAISAQYFERYGDVQAFALNPDLRSVKKDVIVNALNQYVALYGIYDLILMVDSKGKFVAANSKGPKGEELEVNKLLERDYSKEPWFQAVMNDNFTIDKEDNFSGTFVESFQFDSLVESVYSGDRYGNSFSASIKDESGKTIGVISNRAGIRWISVAFSELYTTSLNNETPSMEQNLLAKDGTLLFEYSPSQAKTNDILTDRKTLGKLNLIKSGSKAAEILQNGKSGHDTGKHFQNGKEYILAWQPIAGSKFTETLGWGILVRASTEEAFKLIKEMRNTFTLISLAVFLASISLSYLFAVRLTKNLSALAMKVSKNAEKIADASRSIASSSTELSEAAVEQAASIQETASAIDEVSAMVKKSSENADRSQSASKNSKESAETGQKAVTAMIQSMSDIGIANNDIMSEVNNSNQRISEIVKVIQEIGNKTKVINDIVFQTKLLSFNASVEAARAGEHGKGFAVVAEEVGNLAQMSGNAAKEISNLLDSSIQRVETIVVSTKQSVEKLVSSGKQKLDHGNKVASDCGSALTSILNNVQEVDHMVSEISSAGREQSEGVSEINKAMNQLDQVTQQNTQVAQMAATASEQLSSQSEQLRQMVKEMSLLIYGTDISTNTSASSDSNPGSGDKTPDQTNVHHLEPRKNTSRPLALKKAVGASETPSADDSRFEEV